MGNNFSSKYELFRNVKADDKKGLNRNYGIFLVLRRKTGFLIQTAVLMSCAASFSGVKHAVTEESMTCHLTENDLQL